MAQQNRDEERREGEEQRVGDWRVRLEAMIGELTRTVRMQNEETQERFEQLENARNRQPPHGPNVQRRERVPPRRERDEDNRH